MTELSADCVVCGEPFNDAEEVAAHMARWHRQDADDVRAIRAARALIKPNPTPADEALYRGQGFGVRAGFEAALRLLAESQAVLREQNRGTSGPGGHRLNNLLAKLDVLLIDGPACEPEV